MVELVDLDFLGLGLERFVFERCGVGAYARVFAVQRQRAVSPVGSFFSGGSHAQRNNQYRQHAENRNEFLHGSSLLFIIRGFPACHLHYICLKAAVQVRTFLLGSHLFVTDPQKSAYLHYIERCVMVMMRREMSAAKE